jgi:hypothetical protein
VVTVYGPLWTDLETAIASVFASGDRVQLAFVYKALAVVGNLAILWLLWLVATMWQQSPLLAVAMWAWNPVANIEILGSGHNEALMLVFVLLGLALVSTRQRWLLALVWLWSGALIKFVPLAVAAFTWLAWMRTASSWRSRVVRTAVLGAVFLALTVGTAWPWLSSAAVAEPLFNVAAGGQRFKDVWQDAPAAWLTVRVVPLLGVPDDPPTLRMDIARTMVWSVTRAVFVIYLALEAWWLLRSTDLVGRRIALASLRCLLLAVLLFVSQVYAWYFLWPLPMACVIGWREPWSRAAVMFGLTFLPAFYLREFESYGVFYMPIYGLVALALIVVLRSRAERRTPVLAVAH